LIKKAFILILLVFLTGCTTLKIKDKETFGQVLYKNLKKKSLKVEKAVISGMFKINGVPEIPSIFMEFKLLTVFNEKTVSFRIRALNKNLIDIFIDKNNVYIINNIDKKYFKTDIEKIDFTKVTGINFNPFDVSYLFLGIIPSNDKMEYINFTRDKNEYIMEISDNISKYILNLNKKELLTKVKIMNQYFDTIILDSIRYRENGNGGFDIPHMFVFSSENSKNKISFIINKSVLNNGESNFIDIKNIILNYQFTDKVDDIKLDAEKIKNQIKNN